MWNAGWDDIFASNEWGRYPPEELVRFVARNFYRAPDRSQVRFLEIGCGPGANLWYLAREGFSAHGLDGSGVALERARTRFAAEGLEVELSQGDAVALPYADGYFDCVLDIECIYANDLRESARIIAEARRVLKPGGLFFSKTFMVGTHGDGRGQRLAGEPHTYVKLDEGALHSGYGIIRFTAEVDIAALYTGFASLEYDYLIRSDKGRHHEVREWLITCRKAPCAVGPGRA